jgi:hypothetical protein
MMIAEDRDKIRKITKASHSLFRGRATSDLKKMMPPDIGSPFDSLVPFQRVIDTVHFAKKSETAPLQIADVCAFAIKRHLMGKAYSDRLFIPLVDNLIISTEKDGLIEPTLP